MRISRSLGSKLFLVFGALLFAVGVFFISNRHRLFTQTFTVYADFDRLNGIEKGAPVQLSGLQAGEVVGTEILKWPDGRLRLKLLLGENLHPFVRADSVASIRTSGLAGVTFLDIQKGTTASAEVKDGGTLPTTEPIELADLMRESSAALQQSQVSMKAIQEQTDKTLATIEALTQHVDGTLTQIQPDLVHSTANAQRATRFISDLAQGVQQGQGLAGELLVSPELAKSVAQTAANANHVSVQLNEASGRLNDAMLEFQNRKLLARSESVLENSQRLTAQLSGILGSPEGAAPATLQTTLADTQRTMANLADDTEAIKHNFLLRGFFKNRGYYDLQTMSPTAYRSSKFLKGHTHKRNWVAAEKLFTQDAKAQEALSATGRAEIDAVIGTDTPDLPNNALMIEGYSDAASPQESFRVSQHRADLVRSYLLDHFGLQADLVGVMPMGSVPPAGSQNASWNGISLVILAP